MAEQVQAVLDRMVPALRDLLDKEVFTQTEIKSIVSRRRESEYLLRRRSARKSDYLRYIEAEKNLENLRALRNKKVLARKAAKEREEMESSKKDGNTPKSTSNSSIGDASIIQHLHLLYVRAKRKWKEDLSFHIQHAEFAKEKNSNIMLGKIYAEALQIHPRESNLWIEAASHEYFGYIPTKKQQEPSGGGSIKNARVLLQRGLRVNQDSQELWLQSFCLELHYIQKLRGRREILQLGLKKPKVVGYSDSEGDDERSPVESFYEEAKLPRIIFKNAIKMVPNDVVFRVKFVNNCDLFPETQVIVDEIMSSIENDFGEVEEAWIARAKFAIAAGSDTLDRTGFFASSKLRQKDDKMASKRKHDEIGTTEKLRADPLQILDKATDSIQTSKMFMEAISFAKFYINQICLDSELSAANQRQIMVIGSFLMNIVRKSIDRDILSTELAVECTSVLIELGSPTKALKYIEDVMNGNKTCQESSKCWLKYAETKASFSGDPSISCKILRRALNIIPLYDKGHKLLMSKLFSGLLILSSTEFATSREKELASLYDKLLLISHQRYSEEIVSLPSLALAYMKHRVSNGDIQSAREIYGKLIFASNYPKDVNKSEQEIRDMRALFDQCIIVENVSMKYDSTKSKQQKRQKTMLYDAAFQFFSRNGYSGISDQYTKMKNKDITTN